MPFSPSELIRYSRHFNLPNFGIESQEKLKQAKILIVGAGGLGAPVLQYLTAAGLGKIGIVDFDKVEESNLQRQVLFAQSDVGRSKVQVAKEKLSDQNPNVEFEVYEKPIDNSNALDIINQYDLVIDGTDNFPTRYLVNDACVICGKINVYGSVFRYEGQVSVFNYHHADGRRGPNYRDLYPQPPDPGLIPDCATGGVLGVLPGIIGSFQALEAIKLIAGIGNPLVGKLLVYDALESKSQVFKFSKYSGITITKLINYDDFCGVSKRAEIINMKEVNVQELKQWIDENKDFQLIDVREQNEYDFVNIGGELIPLGNIIADKDKISVDKDVVLMCRSGQRSGGAVQALQSQGYDNLYNLKGGILAWANEIDNSLPTY